jgi:hypothetical protein
MIDFSFEKRKNFPFNRRLAGRKINNSFGYIFVLSEAMSVLFSLLCFYAKLRPYIDVCTHKRDEMPIDCMHLFRRTKGNGECLRIISKQNIV